MVIRSWWKRWLRRGTRRRGSVIRAQARSVVPRLGIEAFETRVMLTGGVEIAHDFIGGEWNSYPSSLTVVNGTLYLTANSVYYGREMWRINASGVAELVEDAIPGGGINPNDWSDPYGLRDVNDTLYFTANDGTNGYELWRINSGGIAELVQDINLGSGSSSPEGFTDVNGTIYFAAHDDSNGRELWRFDSSGIAELVEDLYPGSGSSSPGRFTDVNGTLYFLADDGSHGREMWRINTSGVAELVQDIYPGSGTSSPEYLTVVNGTLYFSANDVSNGYELWRINTSGVAELVEDAIPGGGIYNSPGVGSGPGSLTDVNGTLYFGASDPDHGSEMWRINTSGVAELVQDIAPGRADSSPGGLADVNGTLYFSAYYDIYGPELLRVNSSGVIEFVQDLNPGSGGSEPRGFTDVNGTVYFAAYDESHGRELWRINTSGIAELVEDIYPGSGTSYPGFFTDVNGTLYFCATDVSHGAELFRIISTPTGPAVNLSVSAATGIEAGRTVITVTATAADAVSGDQTVELLVSGSGITAADYRLSDDDLTKAGIQIQILDGQTTGSVTFTILDDLSDETDEVATLTLANPSSGLSLGSPIEQTITLTDDDDAAGTKHLGLPTSGDFRVVLNGSLQEIYDGNDNLISSAAADGAAIVIQGTSADDTLTVDFRNGNPIPAGGITFHGGVGGNDALEMVNGLATSVTHTFLNANDGSIATVIDGSTWTVNYTGLEPIVDNLNATDRVFTFEGGAETITLTDAGDGNMTIDSNLAESVTFANPSGSLTINAGSGNDKVTVVSLDGAFDAELTINGDDGNDSLTGSAYHESLIGGADQDLLRGLGGDDTLFGGSGTNSLDGGAGTDVVIEFSGVRGTLTNTKFVGSGKDTLARIERALIIGTRDNNVLDASAFTLGSVTLYGGDGNDTIRGSKGNDALIGNDGDDLMYGNNGHDRMFGGNGQDRMYGGAGNDTMLGEAGQDTLAGGAGHDGMSGGDGNDFLNGETGNDTLLGGAGNDTLRTSHDFDLALGEDGDDRIESRSKDVISGGEGNNTIVGRYAKIDEAFVFDFNQLLERPFP